jgi:aspartyl-tRNA(Asn)/glutamyl-tRNA(Gln) amidotransferase subunit B
MANITWDPEFDVVIGLEIHSQLATQTKIFCGCPAKGTENTNANTCPVCAGHPGTLPVLNKKVVEYAIRAGLALDCKIQKHNVFSRKNYFYPDLPKGYQISQFDKPICEHGKVEIEFKDGSGKDVTKTIGVTRIHMEEDAGKNVHLEDFSLVNLNRACVPLIEIVSEPDMRSPEEAGAYMRQVHSIVTAIGVCDGNMQEGNFRCDANVSVMRKGATKFGTRAEIKNVNSFKFVEKAIEFEINRQIGIVKSGGTIVQETRLYDSEKNITVSMRSKEEAHDYRYFPEPDLIPVRLTDAQIEKIKSEMPELPKQKRERYVKEYGLSTYDAGVITASAGMATYFDTSMSVAQTVGYTSVQIAKPVANILCGELARLLKEEEIELVHSKITPQHCVDLAALTLKNVISSTGAKAAMAVAWKTGDAIETIIEKEGLKQVSDTGALEKAIDQVIAANPGQVAEFKSGKDKLMGFFVGQAMKATGGKANPGMLQEILKKKLSQ